VEIIRRLPKSGAFQPPYAMQLKFYSLFKQGTLGSCKAVRPGFWDVVGRAKFDAWSELGDLPQLEAKEKYVGAFIDTIKELQKNATPEEVKEALSYADDKYVRLFKPLFGYAEDSDPLKEFGVVRKVNGYVPDNHVELDTDGEEYADTSNEFDSNSLKGYTPPVQQVAQEQKDIRAPPRRSVHSAAGRVATSDATEVISRLHRSLEEVTAKLDNIEKAIRDRRRNSSWTSMFGGIKPPVLLAIFGWPLVVQLVLYLWRRRRTQRVQLQLR